MTRRDVRVLLGKPDYANRDRNPRPHREFGYLVGYQPERGSEIEDSLFMEFGPNDRVVFAEAPARNRAGGYDSSKSGRPVGGGPNVE